ncbi:hypothetical protein GGH95_002881, partial [Coemansia sp. RSA 1836]
VVASAVAPLNIVANINPDEDGNGLLPNLLGRVSATIQASPTVTAHIFDSGSNNNGLFKKDAMPNGIYTERIDDTHVAIYIPLSSLVKTKGQSAVSSLVSVAGSGNVQIVNMSPTPTMPVSSAPTPATTTTPDDSVRAAGTRVQLPMHIVRQEHVATIQAMFPDIPEASIRADLARTGSPAVTSDNILRNGGTLPAPPATRAEQRAEEASSRLTGAANGANRGRQITAAAAVPDLVGAGSASSGMLLNATHSPLATRLRVSKAVDIAPLPAPPPKVWEADSEKRAAILRKRKEFMLMEARKKYQERQSDNKKEGSARSSAPDPFVPNVPDVPQQ